MGASDSETSFPLTGYEPWLMQLHKRTNGSQEFMNPYDHSIVESKIWQLKGKLCLGCFEDWLLLVNRSTKAAYFLHRTLDPNLKIQLASMPSDLLDRLGGCVISSSPTARKCTVTIVGRRGDFILHCRPMTDTNWTEVLLTVDLQENHGFTGQAVRLKGKIYILNCCTTHGQVVHQLMVIDEDSLLIGSCKWTTIQMPNIMNWHHLVVSGDGVFLVSIALSLHRGIPRNYTIHRLETSNQTWKRVEGIGGCVFFLGGMQSSALSAAQAGTQRDCIYFFNQNYNTFYGDGIYKISLRDQTLSLSLQVKETTNFVFWLMPIRSWNSKRKPLSFTHSISTNKSNATYDHEGYTKDERCRIGTTRPWEDLPIELIELLLKRLYLADCIRLPSVCKAWNSLYNPIQDAKVYPWLMYPTKDSCLWRLFDPVFEKQYHIDMTWLGPSTDLTFHCSKDGWVLASDEDNSIFLINPLTRESVSLPHFDNFRSTTVSFSKAPTFSDCFVLALLFANSQLLQIYTWRPGKEKWSRVSIFEQLGTHLPCSPVFIRGEFYWFSKRGKLWVCNPKKKILQVLEIKTPIEMDLCSTSNMECYYIESGGDFFVVFRNHWKDPMSVFKLDQLKKVWSVQNGLGDSTVFLDHRTSIAKPCFEKRCQNVIYLSGFSDEHCNRSASYSLESNRYQPEYYYNFKQPINCIWIEPRLACEY